MGRGRDKTICLSDVRGMSDRDLCILGNHASLRNLKFKGTAVVRDACGNVRYADSQEAGKYGEKNV